MSMVVKFLHIQLLNNSVPFDITGCSVIISGIKEDGNQGRSQKNKRGIADIIEYPIPFQWCQPDFLFHNDLPPNTG